ncbi:DNA polymerase I [Candidatus Poribacteria bacterium]|nr:DNA polymerase I [Candidatus Poribacteria bacterium]
MRKLYLLDGMALAYRAYFVFIRNPMLNSKGFNTAAIHGYATTLLQVLEHEKPTHIAVAFDTPEPTQRHIEYPEYKAQREAMPEDLSASLPYVFRLTEAFNIPALRMPGYEADDVIGTLARRAERDGFQTYMVTPDKDYAQLVDENTFVLKPGKSGDGTEVIGIPQVLEQWGIERVEQVIDVLALWGDSSDNVPGVPGIGEKTAKALVAKYGSVEGLLANTAELKGKQKENVEAFADQARLCKRLVTIDCDVPVTVGMDDLTVREPNRDALLELFHELEFRSLGKRVFGDAYELALTTAAPAAAADDDADDANGDDEAGEDEIVDEEAGDAVAITGPVRTIEDTLHTYTVVDTHEARRALADDLATRERFCFDIETTGLHRSAEPIGLAFSYSPETGFYVPLPVEPSAIQATLETFRPVFENPAIEKVGHNIKFDLAVLKRQGIEVAGVLYDTMIAHALIEPSMRHSMDYLSQVYLGYKPVSIESLIGERGPEQKSMRDVPIPAVAEYAAEDADVTFQLRGSLDPLIDERNARRIFAEVETPLLPALVSMEHAGVRLDVQALRDLSATLAVEIVDLEKRIYEAAGMEFHIDSPKQLGEVLFDVLKLEDKPKKTRTGQYSTREQILTRLADRHEIVELVLRFREYRKLKSTYVDMLPGCVSPETGRVHTHYNQLVTATGRIQSHGPNLQNIPIRTERGREIRRAFVPREDGYRILAADYSQIELRIVAELSHDDAMIAAFRNEADIHSETASRVFGVSTSDVNAEQRRKAKMVNFGVTYGMTAFGLGQRLNIPRKEAGEIIDAYFAQYPGVRGYMTSVVEFAREKGYVETLLGRRRYLRDINSKNATARSGEERNAINTPIQGTAADMIKIAMANIHRELRERNLRTLMLLQVHDELVFDLYEPERDEVMELVERCMKSAIPMAVPIVVEMGVGANWLDAH